MTRPLFLLYLLPLIVVIGFLVTLATGLVLVSQSPIVRVSAFGFPFPWRLIVCETIPCGVLVNWSLFGLDVLFYVAVQYGLIIFYEIRAGKLPRPLSLRQLFSRDTLGVAFQLGLIGGALMLIVPLLIFPAEPGGQVCLDPSPCLTQLNSWRSAWSLMMNLWIFSSLITIFVVVMLVLVGNESHSLFGAFFIALSAVHFSGLGVFLANGVSVFVNISQVLVPVIATTLSVGPLLVFLGGLRLIATGRALC